MQTPHEHVLSRREREIMDVVYRLGEATAREVARRMHDDVGYDSIRVTLSILHGKGHLSRRQDGRRYVYSPAVPVDDASRSAVGRIVRTFFGGSPSKAILAMIDMSSDKLSQEELDEIAAMIEREKQS
jgi:predicted transcriptional regulator